MRLRRDKPPASPPPGGQVITGAINSPVTNSQVAFGNENVQTQTVANSPVTEAELGELRVLFAELKAQIAAEAPPEKQAAALERVEELEQAALADDPDATTIEYVGNWFARNVPSIAGAVAGIVVNPIVGKLVGAAGEALVATFSDLARDRG